MRLWVEPAGVERKSAGVEWKTVTLIYPYPDLDDILETLLVFVSCQLQIFNSF
jgi:hypothetical protein